MTDIVRIRWRWFALHVVLLVMAALVLRTQMKAQETPEPLSAVAPAVRIAADIAHQSKSDDGSQISVLRGNCRIEQGDRKSTRLNSSHIPLSRMPSSA